MVCVKELRVNNHSRYISLHSFFCFKSCVMQLLLLFFLCVLPFFLLFSLALPHHIITLSFLRVLKAQRVAGFLIFSIPSFFLFSASVSYSSFFPCVCLTLFVHLTPFTQLNLRLRVLYLLFTSL